MLIRGCKKQLSEVWKTLKVAYRCYIASIKFTSIIYVGLVTRVAATAHHPMIVTWMHHCCILWLNVWNEKTYCDSKWLQYYIVGFSLVEEITLITVCSYLLAACHFSIIIWKNSPAECNMLLYSECIYNTTHMYTRHSTKPDYSTFSAQ